MKSSKIVVYARLASALWILGCFILFFVVVNNGYQPRPDLNKGANFWEIIVTGIFVLGSMASAFFTAFGGVLNEQH